MLKATSAVPPVNVTVLGITLQVIVGVDAVQPRVTVPVTPGAPEINRP